MTKKDKSRLSQALRDNLKRRKVQTKRVGGDLSDSQSDAYQSKTNDSFDN